LTEEEDGRRRAEVSLLRRVGFLGDSRGVDDNRSTSLSVAISRAEEGSNLGKFWPIVDITVIVFGSSMTGW
jgi:hypothetical protein